MNQLELAYLSSCKRQLEEKFHLQNEAGLLRQRDLEYVADSIEEKSGVRLSLSTLKRIWKEDYEQTPHPSTLDALVSVLGYRDWQDYRLRAPVISSTPSAKKAAANKLNFWVLFPTIAILGIFFWIIAFRTGKPVSLRPMVKGTVVFSGNKTVSAGVPNTVQFNYDVHNVEADSFFFQQSWNEFERTRIDPKGSYYSNIYFYPGFHKAKLIANDSVIKTFKVHITTDGWLPLVRHSFEDSNPVYISDKHEIANGALHVTKDLLKKSLTNLEDNFILSYYNVREFENITSNNFSLETRVVCDSMGTMLCPAFLLTIICEEGRFLVSMVKKGCEGIAQIKIGEVYQDGIHNNLAAFGRDVYSWQQIKIKVVNKQVTIYLDDRPVYTNNYKNDFGKIMGLVYNFTATGAIDFVRLKNEKDKMVYEDDFDK